MIAAAVTLAALAVVFSVVPRLAGRLARWLKERRSTPPQGP